MKNSVCIAAIFSVGLALVPGAGAQDPADQPTAAQAAAPVVPLDQQATKEQLAKLFEVMRVREQLASVIKMMPGMMQQQLKEQFAQMQHDHSEMASLTDEQQQATAKLMAKFMGQAMNLYTADEMIADLSAIYQKHLSRSDVEGITEFYSTPAGRHLLDMSPIILREYMPLMMQRMQERVKPLTEEMTKEMEEIAKTPAPAAAQPTTK